MVWEFANGRSLAAVGDRITKGIVMGVGQVIFVVGFVFFFPSGALSRIKFMLVTNEKKVDHHSGGKGYHV